MEQVIVSREELANQLAANNAKLKANNDRIKEIMRELNYKPEVHVEEGPRGTEVIAFYNGPRKLVDGRPVKFNRKAHTQTTWAKIFANADMIKGKFK